MDKQGAMKYLWKSRRARQFFFKDFVIRYWNVGFGDNFTASNRIITCTITQFWLSNNIILTSVCIKYVSICRTRYSNRQLVLLRTYCFFPFLCTSSLNNLFLNKLITRTLTWLDENNEKFMELRRRLEKYDQMCLKDQTILMSATFSTHNKRCL
jgi:hypothetical protein